MDMGVGFTLGVFSAFLVGLAVWAIHGLCGWVRGVNRAVWETGSELLGNRATKEKHYDLELRVKALEDNKPDISTT